MSDKCSRHISVSDNYMPKAHGFDRFLQPRILVLLTRGDLHGYMIIQQLEGNDAGAGEKIDNAGVYRALKKLEEQGCIYSKWITHEAGAAKKIYRISAAGRECLSAWLTALEAYKNMLETIVGDIKAEMADGDAAGEIMVHTD
jgi:PadR family transcriptional regulator PadR